MIILITKIIIFIVILILLYFFTLKKYVGKYIDNYGEIINHLYYSNNPSKDKTGIYNSNIKLEETPNSLRMRFIEYDDEGNPINTGTDSTTSSNNDKTDSTDSTTSTSLALAPAPAPAPAPGPATNDYACSVCSQFTNINDDGDKICFNDDPTGKEVLCSCRKVCNKCPEMYFDKMIGGYKSRFIEKNKPESTKECICNPEEIISFRGDKCDEPPVGQPNQPAPVMQQLSLAMFLMQAQDLYELGWIARNATKTKARLGPFSDLGNDGSKFISNSKKALKKNKLKLPDDLLGEIDEIFDKCDTNFKKMKGLDQKWFQQIDVPLQRINDDFINIGRDIDLVEWKMKGMGYPDDVIDAALKPARQARSAQKSRTFRDVIKLVEPDSAAELRMASTQELSGKISKNLDEVGDLGDLRKVLNNLDGIDNVDPKAFDSMFKGLSDFSKSVKNMDVGTGLGLKAGKGDIGKMWFWGRRNKALKNAVKPLFKNSIKTIKNIDKVLEGLESIANKSDDVLTKIDDLKKLRKILDSGEMKTMAHINLRKTKTMKNLIKQGVISPEELKRLQTADALNELSRSDDAKYVKELAYDNFSTVDTPKTNPVDAMDQLKGTDVKINQDIDAKLKNKLDINKPPIPDPDVLPDPPANVANDIKSGKVRRPAITAPDDIGFDTRGSFVNDAAGTAATDTTKASGAAADTTKASGAAVDGAADGAGTVKAAGSIDDAADGLKTARTASKARRGAVTIRSSAEFGEAATKAAKASIKSGGKGFGAISKMGKIATKMGKYAGPGMAVVGAAMCFGMENAGNKEKTDQQILEDNGACAVQLLIDVAIEAGLYFAAGAAATALGAVAFILVVFMIATMIADSIDDCSWERSLFTDEYLKVQVEQNNSTFFSSRGEMVSKQLNLALFDFISNNFEKEKEEVNHKLKVYFKYFYDTSVGENTIDPKFKDDSNSKTINPEMTNNSEKIYDHLKVSKQNGLSNCSVTQGSSNLDNCYLPVKNVFRDVKVQNNDDIDLDSEGKLSKEKRDNLIKRIKTEWKYCIFKKVGNNNYTYSKPIKLANEKGEALPEKDASGKDIDNLDYNEYEMLIVPLRDSQNNVLYNPITKEIQWKVVSRGFQNTMNNLIDQYGQGAINYFNSMSIPELCYSWYGDMIDDMEVRLIDIVNKVYVNSNRSVKSMGKAFIERMDKQFGAANLTCKDNCTDEEIQDALKKCIKSIIDTELDKNKYTTPLEFQDHMMMPNVYPNMNKQDRELYISYIKEYYEINRIYTPDWSDEELFQFFLNATREETENRVNRAKKVLQFSASFVAELEESNEAKRETLELVEKRNEVALDAISSMIGSVQAANQFNLGKLRKSIFELKVREFEVNKATLRILKKNNKNMIDKAIYQKLLNKVKNQKINLSDFEKLLESKANSLTNFLIEDADSSDNIDSYMEIYNSLSPTVKSYVDNKIDEDNTELNDYREVIDYSFMKKPDVTPSYTGLYVLFGVEFVALLIIFILFSLFIF